MEPVGEDQIYSRLGDAGFARLVEAFYRRVKTDDLLGPMYPAEDFVGAETRLREFLIQRFGGPAAYSQKRGHPRLRMRHGPFAVDVAARNRWVMLMEASLSEAEIPTECQPGLLKYFHDTATFMINRPAP